MKDSILEWFDDFILGLQVVKDNIKGARLQGYIDASKEIDVDTKNKEMFGLIKRIENLKLVEQKINEDMLNEAISKRLDELLSVIDPRSVLTMDKIKGVFYIGGEMADDGRLANLKAEADFLEQSDIWKVIHNSIKDLAQKTMFVSSETLVDLQKGKSMLYTLDIQDRVVKLLKSFNK